MEQKYLDSLKPRYNLSPTAGSPRGVKHTEETKAKLSRSRRLVDRTGMIHPRAVAVVILDLQGNTVAEFPTQIAAAKWLGVSRPTISQAIKREYTIKKNYRVIVKDSEDTE
jgi:hypothetical protein